MGWNGGFIQCKWVGMRFYTMQMDRNGVLYNENGSEWGVYTMQMGWNGVLYNANGPEWSFIQCKWLGMGFYTMQIGRNGSE